MKFLEFDKNKALEASRGDFTVYMTVSEKARGGISWWLQALPQAKRIIRFKAPEIEICTDASRQGWGAHRGSNETGGHWSEVEFQDHINVLELRAILFGLQSLCPESGVHVRVMTDNVTALTYVKNMGGVRSMQCNAVARQIWSWAEKYDIWITIAFIPGVANEVADFRSRHFADDSKWELNDKIF